MYEPVATHTARYSSYQGYVGNRRVHARTCVKHILPYDTNKSAATLLGIPH